LVGGAIAAVGIIGIVVFGFMVSVVVVTGLGAESGLVPILTSDAAGGFADTVCAVALPARSSASSLLDSILRSFGFPKCARTTSWICASDRPRLVATSR